MSRRFLFVAFALISLVRFQSPTAAAGFEWQQPEGEHTDLLYDGRPALRYMHPKLDDASAETRMATIKPFHHVYSPDGTTLLTKGDADGLYPHHKGIFYGFNKVTYGDGKSCDTWHCTEKAFQESAGTRIVANGGGEGGAGHNVTIHWHGQDGEVFAIEHRGLAMRRETHGGAEGWRIDFTSHLEPAEGVGSIHLDGDPQHAGFHFRASQEVADQKPFKTRYLRTDGLGAPGHTINWDPKTPDSEDSKKAVNRPWNAMIIIVSGKPYSVLYLDHPDNPKPARYSEREYGRFGSYFVADVTKDMTLDVKYRLWIQNGEINHDQCEALHKEFVASN